MAWRTAQIDVSTSQAWHLESRLPEFGAVAIELTDAGDEPILEPAPGETPLWKHIRLTALFDADIEEIPIRLAIAAILGAGAPAPHSFAIVEDEDWVSRLREELQPLSFAGGLWICPTGQSCPDPDATVVTLEPGLAFGTGTHPTTSLCLDWLGGRALRNRTVLDFGCGSGILALAATALGASRVTAVDIDPQARRATADNAKRNAASARLRVAPPDALDGTLTYDFVLANILSSTLIDLGPTLRRYCRSGTAIALSGILSEQAGLVADAYRDRVRLNEPIERDGWVLLTGTTI